MVGNPQSHNRYTYCLNNPLKYIDHQGLSEEESETVEDVETIDKHDFQVGYFEDEDGEGFIFLESDIKKCGNIGVALGSLHFPGGGGPSHGNPEHGLVIIIYDEDGEVEDVQFITFEKLTDENSGALDNLVVELDDAGLVKNFLKALQALEDFCDRKSGNAVLVGLGSAGASFSPLVPKVAAVLAATIGIALFVIGAGLVALYSAARSGCWDQNEDTLLAVDRMTVDLIV